MHFIAALLTTFLLLVSKSIIVQAAEPPTDLVIDVLHKPEPCEVTTSAGDRISVHYTGTLFSTGAKFDSSLDRGSPFQLTLGAGQVIKGWDEGLPGMCVSEKRRLTIPPNKAYGSRGFGSVIPPNSALVFEVELVEITNKRDEL